MSDDFEARFVHTQGALSIQNTLLDEGSNIMTIPATLRLPSDLRVSCIRLLHLLLGSVSFIQQPHLKSDVLASAWTTRGKEYRQMINVVPSMKRAQPLQRLSQWLRPLLSVLCLLMWGSVAQGQSATPPGQPSTGYGSSEGYISSGYRVSTLGNARDGSRIWYFVPDQLKYGLTAPVVVYLHGWTAYLPEYYIGQIEHLVKQGYIVLFPQYQKPGLKGIFSDVDQTLFLERAIKAVDEALVLLDPIADQEDLVIGCHSAGCLITYCWNGAGGAPARALVLTNGSLESDESIPDDVPIVVLDWRPYAAAIDVPLFFLTGEDDPLNVDSILGFDAAINAPVKGVYMAVTDTYGDPDLVADHVAPLASKGNVDALDYRYYYAGLDAVLAGENTPSFDMGSWSDGTPVIGIRRER